MFSDSVLVKHFNSVGVTAGGEGLCFLSVLIVLQTSHLQICFNCGTKLLHLKLHGRRSRVIMMTFFFFISEYLHVCFFLSLSLRFDYLVCRHCHTDAVECDCLVWTGELFFCLLKRSLLSALGRNCFWTTVTLIKSMTRIKRHEAATDWQVFANTPALPPPAAALAVTLLNISYLPICFCVTLFWSRGVSDFTWGEIFWRIAFFFYCFASPFFPPQQCQFSMHRSSKATLSASCWTQTSSFRALAVVIRLNYSSEF